MLTFPAVGQVQAAAARGSTPAVPSTVYEGKSLLCLDQPDEPAWNSTRRGLFQEAGSAQRTYRRSWSVPAASTQATAERPPRVEKLSKSSLGMSCRAQPVPAIQRYSRISPGRSGLPSRSQKKTLMRAPPFQATAATAVRRPGYAATWRSSWPPLPRSQRSDAAPAGKPASKVELRLDWAGALSA